MPLASPTRTARGEPGTLGGSIAKAPRTAGDTCLEHRALRRDLKPSPESHGENGPFPSARALLAPVTVTVRFAAVRRRARGWRRSAEQPALAGLRRGRGGRNAPEHSPLHRCSGAGRGARVHPEGP